MRQIFILWMSTFFALILLVSYPTKSYALSCAQPKPVENYITGKEKTEGSFVIARVMDHDADDDMWQLNIQSTLVGKSISGNQDVIDQYAMYGDLDLKVGELYILQLRENDGDLSISTCDSRQMIDQDDIPRYEQMANYNDSDNPEVKPVAPKEMDTGDNKLTLGEILLSITLGSFIILTLFLLFARIQEQEDEIEEEIEHMHIEDELQDQEQEDSPPTS